ncbi:MAG TPA: DUF1254 domain-containing protein [Micromonosporaceae bacterium]
MTTLETTRVHDEIAALADSELAELTKLAFFWGMHPVGVYQMRYVFSQFTDNPLYVGEGRLRWHRTPLTADDRSVTTPNATTLYGFAFFDLSREPAVIVTPAVPDRYFSVQAADQYPRWYLMIGNQFTGRDPQTHLIVGPNYTGPYPDDLPAAHIHPAPSNVACVAVRYALESTDPDELAAVNALMDQTSALPLSVWEANGRRALRAEDQQAVPARHAVIDRMPHLVAIAENLTGLDLLRMVSLVLNDPTMTPRGDSIHDVDARHQLARLGLRPGVRFDPGWLTDRQKAVVEAAFAEAKQQSEQHVRSETPEVSGHWRLAGAELMPDINDFVKQAYYGLTAIGAPVDVRSHAAFMGFVDADNQPLSGDHRYTITFAMDDLPPVTEFWELPLYDLNGYLVDNAINRYSINSYMLDRGELHIEDGKVVVYVQRDRPTEPNQLANWLPAPDGPFRFAFRYYGPKGSVVDGRYRMPAIVRTA